MITAHQTQVLRSLGDYVPVTQILAGDMDGWMDSPCVLPFGAAAMLPLNITKQTLKQGMGTADLPSIWMISFAASRICRII